jgi:hypothetical protein
LCGSRLVTSCIDVRFYQRASFISIRVLVPCPVSQHFQDIQRGIEGGSASKVAPRIIRLAEHDVQNDMSTYIGVWVNKIAVKYSSEQSPLQDDFKEYLKNLTLANAKGKTTHTHVDYVTDSSLGMSLYAKLVLTNLHALHTRHEVIEAIQKENFPKGLKQAYVFQILIAPILSQCKRLIARTNKY